MHSIAKNRHPVTLSLLALLFFTSTIALADSKTIVSEGTYSMGDGETPTVAEARALQNAKRMAVEQAGTYLQSSTVIRNMQVTSDELQSIAGALMEVEVLEKKRTLVGDGFHFYVKIKATVKPEKVSDLVTQLKQTRSGELPDIVRQYKEMQTKFDQVTKEIDALKRQLTNAKTKEQQEKVVAGLATQEQKFMAIELNKLGLDSLFQQRNYAKAFDYFSQAIAKDPNYHEAYFHRGLVYNHDPTHTAQVIADFTQAIKLNPHPAYYSARGDAYLSLGQKDRAFVDFAASVQTGHEPKDLYASYRHRANVYSKLGQYTEAIADYSQALTLIPSDQWERTYILTERADAYRQLQKYPDAIADYSEAITIQPEAGYLYSGRAMAYVLAGQYENAIPDITKDIMLHDKQESSQDISSLYGLRGMAYSSLGKKEEAIQDFTEAIRLYPNGYKYYSGRGRVYASKGQLEAALNDYTKAHHLNPNDAQVLRERTAVFQESRRFEDAIADLGILISLANDGNERSGLYQWRGWLYWKVNEKEKALTDLTESIRLNPKNARSYAYRGAINSTLGKTSRTRNDFAKACELGDQEACDVLDKLN